MREGLGMYDDLPAEDAVVMAWNVPGDNPHYHDVMRSKVQDSMPVLARAINRLTQERMRA